MYMIIVPLQIIDVTVFDPSLCRSDILRELEHQLRAEHWAGVRT